MSGPANNFFSTALIEDSAVSQVTPKLVFAVESGANTSWSQYKSQSADQSSSQNTFLVPSYETGLGRDIMAAATLATTFILKGVPQGVTSVTYGLDPSSGICVQAFPFNQSIVNANWSINQVGNSINSQQVLPLLLKSMDIDTLSYYTGMTPNYLDTYFYQADGAGAINNACGDFLGTSERKIPPRASYPLTVYQVDRYTTAGGSTPVDHSNIATGAAGEYFQVSIAISVVEPAAIGLSPLSICGERESAAWFGIQQFTLNYSFDASQRRVWCTQNPYITSQVSGITPYGGTQLNGISSMQLMAKYYQLDPVKLSKLPPTNVLPFYTITQSITPYTNNGTIASGATGDVTTSAVQISSIPEEMYLGIRIAQASQSSANNMNFFPIQKIVVTWNQNNGPRAQATIYDLYQMTKRNFGNSAWLEYSGQGAKSKAISTVASPFNSTNYGQDIIALPSCPVKVRPAFDMQLPAGQASSSLGQYNVWFKISVLNTSNATIQPEAIVAWVSSGILVTSLNGISSTYTGLLLNNTVLNSEFGEPVMSRDDLDKEIIGSGMRHGINNLHPIMKRRGMHMMRHKGAGMSGAGMSGAGMSGGGRHHRSARAARDHFMDEYE